MPQRMGKADTSLGGVDGAFPRTTLGLVAGFAASGPDHAAGLQELALRYWKAVYCYIRAVRHRSNEDAKDLTQEFFLWLLSGEVLKRYSSERGPLRAFLKVLLKRFLGHKDVAARRLKRGGGVTVFRLEGDAEPPAGASPDEAFDREWLAALLRGPVERVRERLQQRGSTARLAVFDAYHLAPHGSERTYASIAQELGLKESAVRDHLHAVRQEIREEVRAELARMTTTPHELDDEWRALFTT